MWALLWGLSQLTVPLARSGTPADLPSSGRWPGLVRLEWGEASETPGPGWVDRRHCAWCPLSAGPESLFPLQCFLCPLLPPLDWSGAVEPWNFSLFLFRCSLFIVLLLRIYLHNCFVIFNTWKHALQFHFLSLVPCIFLNKFQRPCILALGQFSCLLLPYNKYCPRTW